MEGEKDEQDSAFSILHSGSTSIICPVHRVNCTNPFEPNVDSALTRCAFWTVDLAAG